MSPDLLPATFATLSDCLTDLAFKFWWNEENAAKATQFGVAEERLAHLISWYKNQFEGRFGAPNVAFSIEVISEFLRLFVDDAAGLVILGCGLSEEHRGQLLHVHKAAEGMGEYGVYEMLEANHPFEPGGNVLGFELMSYEYGLEHSWICNSLEPEVQSRLGISPDPNSGLLDSYEDAARVAEYINRDDVGAEPGLWLPWLVVQYPI